MGRLVIVSREQASFLPTAAVMFAGEPGVDVVLDRRVAGRRRGRLPRPERDERLEERRRRPEIDARLREVGFAVVPR